MSFVSNIFRDAYNYWFPTNVNNKMSKPSLGKDLRLMANSPEFGNQWQASWPFLVAAVTAWPLYWIYRGCVWRKRRGRQPLTLYINKTFYQAKALETGILIAAILMTLENPAKQNTPNEQKK